MVYICIGCAFIVFLGYEIGMEEVFGMKTQKSEVEGFAVSNNGTHYISVIRLLFPGVRLLIYQKQLQESLFICLAFVHINPLW